MSRAEVFSYALLLRGAGRTQQILELLDEAERQDVKTALESLTSIPLPEVRQLWVEHRAAEEVSAAPSL